MWAQFRPVPLDYSWLERLGQTLGNSISQGRERNRITNAIGGATTIEDMARNLLAAGEVDAASKLIASHSLANYRGIQGEVATEKAKPDWKERMIDEWMATQSAQPMLVGPEEADAAEAAEAAGVTPPPVPGQRSFRNAPAAVAKELAPIYTQAQEKAEGKGMGERNSQRASVQEASPGIQQGINQILADVQATDEDTFQNALGPLQGAEDPTSWQDALFTRGAQTWGSLRNYMEQTQGQGLRALLKSPEELPGGMTSEVRDNVKALQSNIIGKLQRVQKVVGLGSQSDAELQQIINEVGKLQNSRSRAEFYRRLAGLTERLKSNGFSIEMPADLSGTPPTAKTAERYSNPSEEVAAPEPTRVPTYSVDPVTGSMSPTDGVNENTMVGGVNIGRTERQPPTPPQKALNALRAYAKNPQARAAFDEIYGSGAAEFYLQKYR